jgi:hypothetical protein
MGFLFLGHLGSLASAEKKNGPIMSNLCGRFFHVFKGNFFVFLKTFYRPHLKVA